MSKELKQAFYDNTFTLKGRIFHPNLLSTRQRTSPKGTVRDVFDVQFAWNPNDPANRVAYQQLLQFMETQKGICFPGIDPRALVVPIKSSNVPGWPEYQRTDFKPNASYLNGHHWINAETGKDQAPRVVFQNQQDVLQEAEVYSGRNAIVNFQLYPMLMDPQDRNKKIGFGVNLNAVMLLEGGEREGGKTQVDVNKVFGGFAQDMGMQPQFGGGFGQQPQQNFQAPPQQAPQYQQPAGGYQGQQPYTGQQAPQQNFQAPPQQAPQWNNQPQQAPQQNFQAPPPLPQGNGAPQGTGQFGGQGNMPGNGAQTWNNGQTAPGNASPSNNQQPSWMTGPQNFNPGQGR